MTHFDMSTKLVGDSRGITTSTPIWSATPATGECDPNAAERGSPDRAAEHGNVAVQIVLSDESCSPNVAIQFKLGSGEFCSPNRTQK